MPDPKTIEIILRGKDQLKPVFDGAMGGVKKFADGTVGEMQRAMGTVLNLQNLIVAGAATMAARSVFKPAIEMGRFQAQLEILLGSADKAKKRLEELENLELTTPFDIADLMDASKKLQLLVGEAYAAGPAFARFTDAAAAAGTPVSTVADAVSMLYANLASGADGGGRAIIQLQRMGLITGEVRGQLEAMAKSGAAPAEIWNASIAALGRFEGAAGRLAAADPTALLGKRFEKLREEIGLAAAPVLIEAVNDIILKIDELRKSGKLDEWGKELGTVIRTAYSDLKALVTFISNNKDLIVALGFSYAGLKILTAAGSALTSLRAGLAAMSAANAAGGMSIVATGANNVAAAVTKSSLAVNILKTGLMGLGTGAAAAGIGLLVAKFMELAKVTMDAHAAVEAFDAKGDYAKDTKSTWSMFKGAWGDMFDRATGLDEGQVQLSIAAPTDDKVKVARADRAKKIAEEAAAKAPGAGLPDDAAGDKEAAAKALKESLDALDKAITEEQIRRLELFKRRQEALDKLSDMAAEDVHKRAEKEIAAERDAARAKADAARKAADLALKAAEDAKAKAEKGHDALITGILNPTRKGQQDQADRERERAERRLRQQEDAVRRLQAQGLIIPKRLQPVAAQMAAEAAAAAAQKAAGRQAAVADKADKAAEVADKKQDIKWEQREARKRYLERERLRRDAQTLSDLKRAHLAGDANVGGVDLASLSDAQLEALRKKGAVPGLSPLPASPIVPLGPSNLAPLPSPGGAGGASSIETVLAKIERNTANTAAKVDHMAGLTSNG